MLLFLKEEMKMIKLLKNSEITINDCKKIGDEIKKVNISLDKIMNIISKNFNVDALDEFLEIQKKIDLLVFQMQEEVIKKGVLDDLEWSEQSNIIRR